jgi:putative hydrolase of the HAD superfamily
VDIEAIVFDVNGTLVDIRTEDGMEEIFRAAGHFLTYQGITLRRYEVREQYFQIMKEQREASEERHPEFDAVQIWRTILERHATDYTRGLDPQRLAYVPTFLAELTRGIARRRLRLYPHVREVLDALRARFPLAVVTDAQSAWARPELNKVGLLHYFDPIVVSGDLGFRKPDPRLFLLALERLDVPAERAVYVGNDMYRDIFGAREVGLTTVMFDSDQGTKEHDGCIPDYTITDHRDLLAIVGIDRHRPAQADTDRH